MWTDAVGCGWVVVCRRGPSADEQGPEADLEASALRSPTHLPASHTALWDWHSVWRRSRNLMCMPQPVPLPTQSCGNPEVRREPAEGTVSAQEP